MLTAWLLFPLVMLVLAVGCGLAVDWAAGRRLPATMLPGVGMALVIVIVSLAALHEKTTELATPAVLVVTVTGYALGRGRLRGLTRTTLSRLAWPIAVAVTVFCICAAPIVLSQNATFLGYFILNDGVFHFSLINQLLSHAHDLTRLPFSSYKFVLNDYLGTNYPTGADLPIGIGSRLTGQDVAWLFQPEQALYMTFGALSVYELLTPAVAPSALRALAATVAGVAGTLFAYYLEASIKEVTTVWLITATIVAAFWTLDGRLHWRAYIPAVVLSGAGYYVLGAAIAPWIALAWIVLVLTTGWRLRDPLVRVPRRRLLLGTVVVAVIVGIPGYLFVRSALRFAHVAEAVLTQPGALGNLVAPLSKWQIIGIWPVDDFRFTLVSGYQIGYALLGVAVISIAFGGLWALRRRLWAPLVLLVGDGVAGAYLLHLADPYASGKVMMILSLAAITGAMLGAAALHDAGRRIEGWLLALVISFGVLWTDALGYRGVSVAPRDRLDELIRIDHRFAGQGPAFYDLQDEYAAYFLRDLAPVDPAEGPPAARTATVTPQGRQPWDPDVLPLTTLEGFRLFVIGNSALASRPPANYVLVDQGRFYDVWERHSTPTVLAHFPLGGPLFPGSIASCAAVRTIAAQARAAHALIAYNRRPALPTLIPTRVAHPPNWGEVGGDPYSLVPRSQSGAATGTVQVPRSGRYRIEIVGSLSQRYTVIIDGHVAGGAPEDIGPPGQIIPVTTVSLSAGRHTISVVRPPSGLAPGTATATQLLGPVLLVPAGSSQGTVGQLGVISPARARSLCGQPLDWIEIVRR